MQALFQYKNHIFSHGLPSLLAHHPCSTDSTCWKDKEALMKRKYSCPLTLMTAVICTKALKGFIPNKLSLETVSTKAKATIITYLTAFRPALLGIFLISIMPHSSSINSQIYIHKIIFSMTKRKTKNFSSFSNIKAVFI